MSKGYLLTNRSLTSPSSAAYENGCCCYDLMPKERSASVLKAPFLLYMELNVSDMMRDTVLVENLFSLRVLGGFSFSKKKSKIVPHIRLSFMNRDVHIVYLICAVYNSFPFIFFNGYIDQRFFTSIGDCTKLGLIFEPTIQHLISSK